MRTLLLCLLIGSIGPLQAQIHNPSQVFVELGGGLLDGTRTGKEDQAGTWLRLGLGMYGNKEGVWQLGVLWQEKYYQVPEIGLIPVRQYLLEGHFTPKFIRSADKKLYLGPSLGAIAGYEACNDRLLDPGGDRSLSKWLVGFRGGISGEWNFTPKTALAAYSTGTLLPSSRVQPFHFHYGLALRVNFFKE